MMNRFKISQAGFWIKSRFLEDDWCDSKNIDTNQSVKNQIPEAENELIKIIWIKSWPMIKTPKASNESNQRLLYTNLNQIKSFKS